MSCTETHSGLLKVLQVTCESHLNLDIRERAENARGEQEERARFPEPCTEGVPGLVRNT